jgi:translation initiation factor IF-3
MQTRINQVKKFATNGHPLKVTLMLKWRENHYADLAMEKINTFIDLISEYYKIEWAVKRNWNTFVAMFKVKK